VQHHSASKTRVNALMAKSGVLHCVRGTPAWLENAAIAPVRCGRYRVGQDMFRRLALLFSVIALGLLLDGCTKCGPIWDDWMQSPKSCKSDRL
jgi:hypothetical protein